MPERGDLLLAAGGAGGDRAMESTVQHGTAPFVTGLQAPGTRSNLAAATGAWRYGKRSAFPTSPHPRRRRTNVERRVTLTFHLVQKICQVNVAVAEEGAEGTHGVGDASAALYDFFIGALGVDVPLPRVFESRDLGAGAGAVFFGEEDVVVLAAVEGRVEVDEVDGLVLDVFAEDAEVVA